LCSGAKGPFSSSHHSLGPGRYCSPRPKMPGCLRAQETRVSTKRWMTWLAISASPHHSAASASNCATSRGSTVSTPAPANAPEVPAVVPMLLAPRTKGAGVYMLPTPTPPRRRPPGGPPSIHGPTAAAAAAPAPLNAAKGPPMPMLLAPRTMGVPTLPTPQPPCCRSSGAPTIGPTAAADAADAAATPRQSPRAIPAWALGPAAVAVPACREAVKMGGTWHFCSSTVASLAWGRCPCPRPRRRKREAADAAARRDDMRGQRRRSSLCGVG